MKDRFLDFLINEAPSERPVALDSQGDLLTLGDLRGEVAAWMERIETHPGLRWALNFQDTFRFLAALFAVMLKGGKPCLPDSSRPGGLEELSSHFDGILTDHEIELPGSGLVVEKIAERSPPREHAPIPVKDDPDYGMVFFTSGSTGTPKPIDKSFAQISREAAGLEGKFGAAVAGCHAVTTVSHHHLYGFTFRLFFPLACGLPFAVDYLRTPEQVAREARPERLLIASPAMLKRLEGIPRNQGYGHIFSGGGELPMPIIESCEVHLGRRPNEFIGSSEMGVLATRVQTSEGIPFTPLPGVEVATDGDGHLKVRSSYLALDAVDEEGWQTSEDLITLEPDGRFHHLGRSDRVVKIEEKRISLDNVERMLEKLEDIQEAVVVPLPSASRQQIGAVVVLTELGRETLERMKKGRYTVHLRQLLHRHLEPLAIPRRFRVVDAIPVNLQGKATSAELQRLFT